MLSPVMLPAAVITLWWLATYHHGHLESKVLMDLLGAALLVTAALMMFRTRIVRPLRRAHIALEQTMRRVRFSQIAMTVVGGAVVGALVTLTSVGAGALIAVGKGERDADWLREVLASGDRTRAGVTAPAQGLYFAAVEYPATCGLPVPDVQHSARVWLAATGRV